MFNFNKLVSDLAQPFYKAIVCFVLDIRRAGVVPYGGREEVSLHSSLVQILFYFWSFEIKECVLRNRK